MCFLELTVRKITNHYLKLFVFFLNYFSIHTYTHVQFQQLHNRNKIYKKWYTQEQSLDIKIVWYI